MPLTGVTELRRADAWFRSTLLANADLVTALGGNRVYYGKLPRTTAYPAIVYAFVSGYPDVNPMGDHGRAYAVALYEAKVIGEGTYTAIDAIVQLMDSLLNGKSGGGPGWSVDCKSMAPIRYEEEDPESHLTYVHQGWQYRVIARSA